MKDFTVFSVPSKKKREVKSKTGRTFWVEEDKIHPVFATGRAVIDFTDPVTGKIKQRIDGNNHVFTESLFSTPAASPNWMDGLNYVYCCLNDSIKAIDPTIPYLFGQTIGYGRPSVAGAGTRRGAYNAANQVLGNLTPDSARWLFQYDFTSAQANGEPIGTIGLTFQYNPFGDTYALRVCHNGFRAANMPATATLTCDGRYAYSCSTDGIITKYDLWTATSTTINVSSVVGTASLNKVVGHAPATGKYYVFVGGTSAQRRMYEFSDATFSTLLNTYYPSNTTQNAIHPMYIYGTTAYWFHTTGQIINYSDFVNDTAQASMTISSYSNAAYNESTTAGNGYLGVASCSYGEKYVFCSGGAPAAVKGIIFDLSTADVAGYVTCVNNSSNISSCIHPFTTEKIVCSTYNGAFYHKTAIAAKKLDTPVTKTSANGMTVTYELEVFWE